MNETDGMPGHKKPVLIVDDEQTNRDLLSRRLERAGFDVKAAASGPEALEMLDAHAVDLVLLDNMMPGMSGVELLRLTYSASDLPVIMVTSLADSERVVER
jgi:CheY-like chemotaxis protein